MSDSVPEGAISAPERSTRSRWGRTLVVCVLATCLVVAIVGVALATTSSRAPSAGAAVIVRRALVSTLAENSMSFTLNESGNVAGTSVDVSGNGECDLTNALCGMTMEYGGVLSTIGSLQVLYSSGVTYLNMSALSSLISTPWISIKVTSSGASSLGLGESPLSGLSLLASEGATVTNDGTVSENGQQMTQYTVTASAAQEKKILGSVAAKLPSWIASAAQTSETTVSEVVDIDSAGRLGYLSAQIADTVAGTSASITVSVTVTGYGAPVNVAIPPASEVTPINSLGQLSNL